MEERASDTASSGQWRRASDSASPLGIPLTPEGDQAKRDMEQDMLAFDTNLAPIVGQQVTLTAHHATPLGSGRRIGIDRDLDGALDGDERAAGSNPADASSVP